VVPVRGALGARGACLHAEDVLSTQSARQYHCLLLAAQCISTAPVLCVANLAVPKQYGAEQDSRQGVAGTCRVECGC